MAVDLRLTKHDGDDIGFALNCLSSGAIQFREFKEWLCFVIEHTEAPPGYMFDMLDVKKRVDFKPHRIMGWTHSSSLTKEEHHALAGIGFVRGINSFEDQVTREEAIRHLRNNKVFYKRASDFFPFLDLEEWVGPDPDKGW